MEEMVKCWEVFKCKKKECPVYKSKDLKCWLISGTHCRDEIQEKFLDKMEICLGCEVFQSNIDVGAMKETISVVKKQFKEFRTVVKDREGALREKAEREALILRSVPIAIYTAQTSGDFGWIWVSEQIDSISGFSPEMHIKDPHFWVSRLQPDDRERVLEEFKEIQNKGAIVTEYHWQCANGSYRWFRNQAVLIRDENGNPKEIVGTWVDITDRKEAEDILRAQSLVDELTGLYNRRGFLTLAEQQLRLATRMKKRMLLFFSDLDNLKWINDNLGHNEGDSALIDTASSLKETFRDSDIIARIGGDEFVVLAVGAEEPHAEILTTRLLKNLKANNSKRSSAYNLSISIGIACFDPEHPCSINELMTRADELMYEQKQKKQQS